jgi:Tfp pilus assembly protein PilF
MKKKAIYLFIFLWLLAAPAYGDNAMDYFNLGVKGSATHKKIEYYTKALELNPALSALPGKLRQSNSRLRDIS